MKIFFVLSLIIIQTVTSEDDVVEEFSNTPVVFWHGMGDSCCFPFSMGMLKKLTEETLNNTVYVKSLEIGGSYVRDYESSYFIHPWKQVDDVCRQIQSDPHLMNRTFNAVGFSQGSQFLRALVQHCPEAKVKNLITFGGQHQGVFGLPDCPSLTSSTCDYVRKILNFAAYAGWLQKMLVQATYWHDPLNEDLYRNKSSFLAEINNERKINKTYKKRLQTLNKFVMIKFENDTIVQPVETSWFGFFRPGSDTELMTLEESEIFTKDKLGLKKMKKDDKLVFLAIPGNHMQISKSWFVENVIETYLRD